LLVDQRCQSGDGLIFGRRLELPVDAVTSTHAVQTKRDIPCYARHTFRQSCGVVLLYQARPAIELVWSETFKVHFRIYPDPAPFSGRFQYFAHLERGGRGNPILPMLFPSSVDFCFVGFAKGQKPRAKSCSSLIASTSSDDDQMQRSAGDCRRIGTRCKLDAAGLVELD